MPTLFKDLFTGSGDFDGRSPDVGGAYTNLGSNTLADLDYSSGAVPSSLSSGGGSVWPASAFGVSPATGTILTVYFVAGAATHDILGGVTQRSDSEGNDLVFLGIGYDSADSVWYWTFGINDHTGASLFYDLSAFPDGFIPTGATQVFTVTTTGAGTTLKLDGTPVSSTSEIPDVGTDTIYFNNSIDSDATPPSLSFESLEFATSEDFSGILSPVRGEINAINDTEIYVASSGILTPIVGAIGVNPGLEIDIGQLSGHFSERLIHGVFAGLITGYNLFSTGHQDTRPEAVRGFHGTLHTAYSLRALGGAQARLTAPTPTLVSAGTTTNWGIATLVAPSPRLVATGTEVLLGRAFLVYGGHYTLNGLGGAQARLVGPRPRMAAAGHGGILGTAHLVLRTPYSLLAAGTQGNYGILVGVLPGLAMANYGAARLTGPHYRLVATGHNFDLSPEYEAYSVAFVPGGQGFEYATTRYTDYPFERIVRFGSTYYGVGVDGIFELDGDTFDGDPIVAAVQTAETDFGDRHQHRPISLYLSGRMGADMVVYVTSAEIEVDSYTYTPAIRTGSRNQRAKFGKGIKARYMAYGFSNADGDDFELDELTPEIAVLRRTA